MRRRHHRETDLSHRRQMVSDYIKSLLTPAEGKPTDVTLDGGKIPWDIIHGPLQDMSRPHVAVSALKLGRGGLSCLYLYLSAK